MSAAVTWERHGLIWRASDVRDDDPDSPRAARADLVDQLDVERHTKVPAYRRGAPRWRTFTPDEWRTP